MKEPGAAHSLTPDHQGALIGYWKKGPAKGAFAAIVARRHLQNERLRPGLQNLFRSE